MKKYIVTGMMIAALTAGTAMGGDVSVSADLASAYVFRGATLNDGAVFQPGMEAVAEGLTLGVWGNLDLDDYDGALEDGEFSEIDLYGSYEIPMDAISMSIGYTEYAYPGSGGDPEVSTDEMGVTTASATRGEADREVNLGLSASAPGSPSLSVNYGLGGAIDKSLYVEGGLSHECMMMDMIAMSLSAAVGYLDPDEGESGFSHYSASVGGSYGCFTASLTHIGRIDDDVLPDVEDGGAYDVELVGMAGIAVEL